MSRPGKLTELGMLAAIGAMMLPVALCEHERQVVRPAEVRLPAMRPGYVYDWAGDWMDYYHRFPDGTWIRMRSR
jgi:hypothetical protein